jgi:hypothetical protein
LLANTAKMKLSATAARQENTKQMDLTVPFFTVPLERRPSLLESEIYSFICGLFNNTVSR